MYNTRVYDNEYGYSIIDIGLKLKKKKNEPRET